MTLIFGIFFSHAEIRATGGKSKTGKKSDVSRLAQDFIVTRTRSNGTEVQLPSLSSALFSQNFPFPLIQGVSSPHFLDVIWSPVWLQFCNIRSECCLLTEKIISEDWKEVTNFVVLKIFPYVRQKRLVEFGKALAAYICSTLNISDQRKSDQFRRDIEGSLGVSFYDFFTQDYDFDRENFSALFPTSANEAEIQREANYLKEKYKSPKFVKKTRKAMKVLLDERKNSDQELVIKKVFEEVFGDGFFLKKFPKKNNKTQNDSGTVKERKLAPFLKCIEHIVNDLRETDVKQREESFFQAIHSLKRIFPSARTAQAHTIQSSFPIMKQELETRAILGRTQKDWVNQAMKNLESVEHLLDEITQKDWFNQAMANLEQSSELTLSHFPFTPKKSILKNLESFVQQIQDRVEKICTRGFFEIKAYGKVTATARCAQDMALLKVYAHDPIIASSIAMINILARPEKFRLSALESPGQLPLRNALEIIVPSTPFARNPLNLKFVDAGLHAQRIFYEIQVTREASNLIEDALIAVFPFLQEAFMKRILESQGAKGAKEWGDQIGRAFDQVTNTHIALVQLLDSGNFLDAQTLSLQDASNIVTLQEILLNPMAEEIQQWDEMILVQKVLAALFSHTETVRISYFQKKTEDAVNTFLQAARTVLPEAQKVSNLLSEAQVTLTEDALNLIFQARNILLSLESKIPEVHFSIFSDARTTLNEFYQAVKTTCELEVKEQYIIQTLISRDCTVPVYQGKGLEVDFQNH
ncbi:hypothetical protein [Holospora curviuscula]|nr:hypothetical protein [Holospora curviuscula]